MITPRMQHHFCDSLTKIHNPILRTYYINPNRNRLKNKPKALKSIKVSKESGMPLVGEAEKEVINSMWDPVLTLGPKGKTKKMGDTIRKTSETQIKSVI